MYTVDRINSCKSILNSINEQIISHWNNSIVPMFKLLEFVAVAEPEEYDLK